MGYDKKYKQRVVEYRLEGNKLQETADIFKVSTAIIKIWVKEFKETGEFKEPKIRNRKPKKVDPEKLIEFIENNPDAYLYEIAEYFGCNESAIRQRFKSLGITRKKRQPLTKNKMKTK